MLSRAKITSGRAGYYTAVVAGGLDDYMSGAGESPGLWAGSGAAAAGLSGVARTEQIQSLFEGDDPCHPLTGVPLGGTYAVSSEVDKVMGWDLTVSAPKSFSTLWAVAPPRLRGELDECHSAAVDAAVSYLEVHGAFSRVGRGGRFQVDTEGLVIAWFDHRTSRAGDPQRHSHLLVSNRVRCADGVWRALDSRALHSQLKAAGAVYQAGLRAETANRVGVRWDLADTNGQADIDGVPGSLLARWSTRRTAVLVRGAERIAESERALGRSLTAPERRREYATATLETRPDKVRTDDDVHERWRAEAVDHGSAPADWLATAVNRGRPVEVDCSGLVELAIAELSEARSTWARPDLVVAVAAVLPPHAERTADATRALVEELVEQGLRSGQVVDLSLPVDYSSDVAWRRDGVPLHTPHDHQRFSTVATVAAEVEVLDFATRPDTHRAQVHPDQVDLALDGADLSPDQVAAVRRLATDGAALLCLVGPAGTGKTTTIAAAAQVWAAEGIPVRGVAVSAVAAEVLGAELGAPAETLAKLLHEQRRPGGPRPPFRLRAGEVIIVDEASMVSTRQFRDLTRLAEAHHAKVVAVGDYRQLGAVDAGGLFQLLARDTDAAELTGGWRFAHRWERTATVALRNREPSVADRYASQGRIHGIEGDDVWDDMVRRWAGHVAKGESVVMIAQRREDAATLASLARARLVAAGRVAPEGRRIGGQTISEGDVIVTLRNDRTLRTDRGRWVRNGDRWTVTKSPRHGGLQVINPERGTVSLPHEYIVEHVALGYAVTAHKAQGMTVDHAVVHVDDTTSAEALYVAMSRGRRSNHAFVGTTEAAADPAEVFRAAVGRDTTELSALGYLRHHDPDHSGEREAELRADIASHHDGRRRATSDEHGIDDGMDHGL